MDRWEGEEEEIVDDDDDSSLTHSLTQLVYLPTSICQSIIRVG